MICHSPRPSVSRPRRRAGVATPTRRAATPAALPFSVLRRTKCNESPVKTSCKSSKPTRCYHSNQQYSVIALTDNTGAITERYAYSAYGEPVFVSATGTVLADSAEGNRYTYTSREWDEGLGLYHFRARMYDAGSGRFLGRDSIGYEGDTPNVYQFVRGSAILLRDWSGMYSLGYPGQQGSNVAGNCSSATDLFTTPYQASIASWSNASLPSILGNQVYGWAAVCFDVNCDCKQCGEGACGCKNGPSFPVHCKLSLTIHIFLDLRAIERDGQDIDLVFGHEQRHVNSYLRTMRWFVTGENDGWPKSPAISTNGCMDSDECDETADLYKDRYERWFNRYPSYFNKLHGIPVSDSGNGLGDIIDPPVSWPDGKYPSLGGVPAESTVVPPCAQDIYNRVSPPAG